MESSPAPERGGYAYPLFRRNDRTVDAGYAGPLYVWDIDNTYLLTEWTSLRDLIRIRFEAAEDKLPVPGAVSGSGPRSVSPARRALERASPTTRATTSRGENGLVT